MAEPGAGETPPRAIPADSGPVGGGESSRPHAAAGALGERLTGNRDNSQTRTYVDARTGNVRTCMELSSYPDEHRSVPTPMPNETRVHTL